MDAVAAFHVDILENGKLEVQIGTRQSQLTSLNLSFPHDYASPGNLRRRDIILRCLYKVEDSATRFDCILMA